MSISMLTESVEWVWVVWAVCLALFLWMARRAMQRSAWNSFQSFLADESGASYALPYVMTLPFLMVIVCCLMQGTLILVAKFGTMHAGYAAARAAIVWQGADPSSSAESRELADKYADRAAITGMVPFAAGTTGGGLRQLLNRQLFFDRGMNRFDRVAFVATHGWAYNDAYKSYAKIRTSQTPSPVITDPDALSKTSYIDKKFEVASFCTDAAIIGPPNVVGFNEDVEVRVTYVMPLQVPLAAKIFDNVTGFWAFFDRDYYAREISTTVTLPSEAARMSTGRLEVPYYPEEIH